jgi:hypothetical protein
MIRLDTADTHRWLLTAPARDATCAAQMQVDHMLCPPATVMRPRPRPRCRAVRSTPGVPGSEPRPDPQFPPLAQTRPPARPR